MDLKNIGKIGDGGKDLAPQHRKAVFDSTQQNGLFSGGHALQKTHIAHDFGNLIAENDDQPDIEIPESLFNFDLILGTRRFRVLVDTLIRIKNEEDLGNFTPEMLNNALERCASYRYTCFSAYVAAKKMRIHKKEAYKNLMAELRHDARVSLKAERIIDKQSGIRKEIGTITTQEIEDYVRRHNPEKRDKARLELLDWEENEEMFLEMRDTLKDRGMHLQTLLKRVADHMTPLGNTTQSNNITTQ